MKPKKVIRYRAPALEKGLDILEFLADQPVPRSQTEIGAALKRSQSEIYRMLACLEERGYVVKQAPSGSYRLSLRLFELAHRQSSTGTLRQAGLMPLDALAEETGQSVHLSVQHGNAVMVLIERMPTRHICLAVGEGTTLPLSRSTSGKVILGRMTPQRVADVLKSDLPYQTAPAARRRAVDAGIAEARRLGHLVTASDLTPGAVDVAFPVGVADTDTAAVVDMPFILPAHGAERLKAAHVKAVRACAEQINQNLGITS